jgi:hypothetical protein
MVEIKKPAYYENWNPVPDPFYIAIGAVVTGIQEDWRKHKLKSVLKDAKKEIPELKSEIEKVEEALKTEDYVEVRKKTYPLLKELVPKIERKKKELAEAIGDAWDKFRKITIWTNPLTG